MRRLTIRAGVLVAVGVLAATGSASAATLKVTRTGDPAPGACTADDCSLREAVRHANTTAAGDKIVLRAKSYQLTQVAEDDDALAGDLDILGGSGRLTVVGQGPGKTTIAGNGVDRVWHVLDGGRATLQRLALTGGNTGHGGAIRTMGGSSAALVRTTLRGNLASFGGVVFTDDESALVVKRSLFRGNDASFGGALMTNNTSRAKVVRSRFRGNEGDYGGGIYNQNEATLVVKKSTFERNRSVGGEGGGAIFNQNDAVARISGSTITKNTAANDGGGIFAKNRSTLSLVNSTVSGNEADLGGGIYLWQQGKVTTSFSTITRNRALTAGGGVYDDAEPPGPPAPPYLRFRGTIIAGNMAPGATDNCVVDDPGNWLSLGSNLESANTCRFRRDSDQRNAAAKLRELARNGGPTKTHALQPSSDAVDAAREQGCPNRDQRGVKRPQGSRCDTGSFELKRR